MKLVVTCFDLHVSICIMMSIVWSSRSEWLLKQVMHWSRPQCSEVMMTPLKEPHALDYIIYIPVALMAQLCCVFWEFIKCVCFILNGSLWRVGNDDFDVSILRLFCKPWWLWKHAALSQLILFGFDFFMVVCVCVWAANDVSHRIPEFLFWASGPMINVTSYHLRQFVCLLVCNCFWSPMSHVLHLNVIFWLSVVRLCGNASRIPPRSEVQVKLIIMFVCLLVWNFMKFDKVFMLDLNTAFAVAFFAGW